MAIIPYNSKDIVTSIYPLKEEIDKKIEELDNKINKIARTQAKKVWTGSRKRRKK